MSLVNNHQVGYFISLIVPLIFNFSLTQVQRPVWYPHHVQSECTNRTTSSLQAVCQWHLYPDLWPSIAYTRPGTFRWIFIIADVKKSVLGGDFLRAYNLLVDMGHKRLSDTPTHLNVQGITAHSSSPSPSLLSPRPKTGFEAILCEFPTVIQPCNTNHPIKHEVTYHITITAPPVYPRARRLSLERLKIAQQEFEHMLDLATIRPSASSWSSPLHMVPKKTPSDWRPCSDYRVLNNATTPNRYPTPHIQDSSASLHGSTIFYKIDLVHAYHWIPVKPADVPKIVPLAL